ncbi:copper-binding protein [Sphingomonas canadensis]|uniref:Copper-binding protein n=1 Tax=Sphingomonas canadensis TaxID=1219257 RepID=A0ABW3H879_9SPHN|nr:copper-binding protein [Sphingomonas canadensis]MCW3837268.1 copper-binding protein [Sphingomonas canadensis]
MKTLYLAAVLAAASLSACGQKAETNAATAETPAATNAGTDMGNMAMPADAKMAKSIGTVTAIDKTAGKITLDHQAIPEVNWPAMTMTFSAKPEILSGIAVGDKVAFDVTVTGNAGEVTAVTKQ